MRATVQTLLSRLPEGPRYYGRGLFRELTTKDVFLWAQAIAFKALVSIVPLLVLATGVTGRVLRMDRPFELVASFLEDFLPSYQSSAVLTFLDTLAQASGTITLVGSIGLLVTAMSIMTTMRIVISNVFREDYHKARPILRGYGFDLRMVAQVGVLFLMIFAFLLTTEWIQARGTETMAWLGWNADWLTTGWATLFSVISLLVPLLLGTLMFAQLYYFIPRPHPPRASVWRGAFVTALLWEISKRAFTFYAVRAARFDMEGGFGIVLALVFWIYYSGIVLIVGAIIVLLSEKRRRAAAGLSTRPEGRLAPEACHRPLPPAPRRRRCGRPVRGPARCPCGPGSALFRPRLFRTGLRSGLFVMLRSFPCFSRRTVAAARVAVQALALRVLLRRPSVAVPFAVAALLVPATARLAHAQAPLFLADEQTTVRAVSFTFATTKTFSEDELRALLATKGPTFADKVRRQIGKVLPFVRPKTYPLERIEVQKDVVRLRQFYRLNGFFDARIDYPASQLDTAANTIRIVYSVDEGAPLRVRNLALFAQDSTGNDVAFPADLQRGWGGLDDRDDPATGTALHERRLCAAQGRGARLGAQPRLPLRHRPRRQHTLDLEGLGIDLALTLTPGPRARVDAIEVEGNTSVSENVVRREVPFEVGEYFSQRQMVEGHASSSALTCSAWPWAAARTAHRLDRHRALHRAPGPDPPRARHHRLRPRRGRDGAGQLDAPQLLRRRAPAHRLRPRPDRHRRLPQRRRGRPALRAHREPAPALPLQPPHERHRGPVHPLRGRAQPRQPLRRVRRLRERTLRADGLPHALAPVHVRARAAARALGPRPGRRWRLQPGTASSRPAPCSAR